MCGDVEGATLCEGVEGAMLFVSEWRSNAV